VLGNTKCGRDEKTKHKRMKPPELQKSLAWSELINIQHVMRIAEEEEEDRVAKKRNVPKGWVERVRKIG